MGDVVKLSDYRRARPAKDHPAGGAVSTEIRTLPGLCRWCGFGIMEHKFEGRWALCSRPSNLTGRTWNIGVKSPTWSAGQVEAAREAQTAEQASRAEARIAATLAGG